MIDKERFHEIIGPTDNPVYEVFEEKKGGDIIIRMIEEPKESIMLFRSVIPRLIQVLNKIEL